ncbi:transmembrane family-2 glycosyl transferase [Christiangramia salexigens]|uniref:Transmembrane family-2 glycosyl transferase n=1 Tax=Christiangramia salexigens TaxID=1913577 RepID=A0A1L3J8I1_9FLAO|nr:transmembrane family-2 glycosyl transferase [Christiangramia salexigens]
MVSILVLITATYIGLILFLIYGWKKTADFKWKRLDHSTGFSVIIPYRNEEKNLKALFQSIGSLRYSKDKFEIILVNDDSSDNSLILAREFQERLPELNIILLENDRKTRSPKKDAIQTAILRSNFEFIVTTDADSVVPPEWLAAIDEEIQSSGAKLIAGPVGFIKRADQKLSHFQRFEELDFLSLQGTTVGSFGIGHAFMCNAANLCYEKQSFMQFAGFKENDEISSGDDVFLLQKFREGGLKISFLKSVDGIVRTGYQENISGLIEQRKRWAAKTTNYKSLFGKLSGLIVFVMNLSLIVFAGMALFGLFPYMPLMLAFLFKFNLDFVLIYLAARFFKREEIMRNYLWASIMYPFFVVYITLLSMLTGFDWKGRHFKK